MCCIMHAAIKLEEINAKIQKILDDNDAKLAAYDEEINKSKLSTTKQTIH